MKHSCLTVDPVGKSLIVAAYVSGPSVARKHLHCKVRGRNGDFFKWVDSSCEYHDSERYLTLTSNSGVLNLYSLAINVVVFFGAVNLDLI